MKDFKFAIAIFAIILLVIPLVSVKLSNIVQLDRKGYSSSAKVEEGDPSIKLEENAGFKILRTATGKVEEIPSVDYICGVVAAEMPASYNEEALKAQAVAAFTYAYYKKAYNLAHPEATKAISGADLSDDFHLYQAFITKSQAQQQWGTGFEKSWDKIYSAVCAVQNYVITYSGKPIEADFFSVSSGKTENCKDVWGNVLPYLVSVGSEWDIKASDYSSKVTISQNDFKKAVQTKYKGAKFDIKPEKWLSSITRSSAGGVISANLCSNTLTGNDLRQLFNLKSANFTLSFKNSIFTFDVKGSGHGVGMSQFGAQALALQGKKWNEIIKYFYTGVEIFNLYW